MEIISESRFSSAKFRMFRNSFWRLSIPGGALLLATAALTQAGWLTLALPSLQFLYFAALCGGAWLAWRFHSSRVLFALVVLWLAREAIIFDGGVHASASAEGRVTLGVLGIFVSLNFIVLEFMHERGFVLSSFGPVALLLFVEAMILVVVFRSVEPPVLHAVRSHQLTPNFSLPGYTQIIFGLSALVLLVRAFLTRKPAEHALFWALLTFYFSLRFASSERVSTAYGLAAACMLAISIVESSYLLAYHDELTSLPSRRAFNDALLRLQTPFSIAVVDIDHFKRFNDTYGHDIGDQVLRLVAANLGRVGGGGLAYRCGGEEFVILFPKKKLAEVNDHLEQLRELVEKSKFRMRGPDRRQVARGPERRNERTPNHSGKDRKVRQLTPQEPSSSLSVTVSIGVAQSTANSSSPDPVLQAADKALYRAKANGRNRVECAARTSRSKSKAAGIA